MFLKHSLCSRRAAKAPPVDPAGRTSGAPTLAVRARRAPSDARRGRRPPPRSLSLALPSLYNENDVSSRCAARGPDARRTENLLFEFHQILKKEPCFQIFMLPSFLAHATRSQRSKCKYILKACEIAACNTFLIFLFVF